MLLELVVTACLAATGADCRSVVLDTYASPTLCTIEAQPRAAVWAIEHPFLVITRLACRPAGKDA